MKVDVGTTSLKNVVGLVEKSVAAQFFLTLALIVGLKWEALSQLPTWDTAMGVFPPAFALVDNGFDLLRLLRMPGYTEGGPNVHSTSVVTLITALVIKVVGVGRHAYVVLHLLHFSVAAAALMTLFRFARLAFSRRVALLFCLSVLLQPVFSTQVGYLYLEMPLFLCAVSALLAWVRRRFVLAVFWGTLAYAIKDAGIIVPCTLVAATLLEGRPWGQKLKRALILLGVPVILSGAVTVMGVLSLAGRPNHALFPSAADAFIQLLSALGYYLRRTPDVMLLLAMFLAGLRFWGKSSVQALTSEPSESLPRSHEQGERLVLALSGLLILMFLALFYFALPLLVRFTLVLPRYYVLVLPFLILWAGYQVRELAGRREGVALGCFGLLCVIFGLNSSGLLYPSDVDARMLPGNDPSLTERSNAYLRLNRIQLEAMRYLQEELPEDAVVYYGLYEHYLLHYPRLGYSSGPLPNGHTFFLEPFSEFVAQDPFPSCTYALSNYPALGGEGVHALLNEVAPEKGFLTELVREFRDGPYKITISLVRRPGALCPHDRIKDVGDA